jgi:Histidine kinase-, DNA gyrase B-, and HSP90-like ATPase
MNAHNSTVSSDLVENPADLIGDNEVSPQWGESAPRGGKTVLGRILKDGAKVPLFLGQTLVNSLRDLGYNSTTSALCEHVDNAIQWGATEIRIYFRQTGKRGELKTAVLVYDNGKGMASHVLKVATAFGGSMVYGNRMGIGRYGMGMKAAALSMSPVLEVYSWQERNAIYSMTLDVEDVGSNKSNLIELPDPTLNEKLPSEIVDILTKVMVYPKNPQESQKLFASSENDLSDMLPNSGTIVFMPECDRLSFKTAQSLVDHATKEMGRIYRRFIAKGIKIFVNNRQLEAFDPTYSMHCARHTRIDGLPALHSKLIRSWPIEIPVAENSAATTTVKVRLFALPYEQWSGLSRKVLKNDLHVFDDHTVSFMRNDREVEIGSSYPKLKLRKGRSDVTWLRLEIDLTGDADEGAGVAANKQGVRLQEYFAEKIVEKIGEEVSALREVIRSMQAKRTALKSQSKVSEAERRATDAEAFQGKPLPQLSEAEQAALDENLRGLAVTLKHDAETDEQAFERVKASRYLTVFKHDEYWPFYHCDYKYGKVILTVNTAHPFFQRIWEPLSDLSNTAEAAQEGADDAVEVGPGIAETCRETLLGVQAMLFSLARTQSQLSIEDPDGERKQTFEKLRREWSENLTTQLNAK